MKAELLKDYNQVEKSVCEFYIKHRSSCDKQYNRANSSNIKHKYEEVENQDEINKLFSQVGIVVITANMYEKNILHSYCHIKNKVKIKRIKVTLVSNAVKAITTYAYCFSWYNYRILHVESQSTGSHTMGGSSDTVRFVIDNKYLFPTVIISMGICFGVDNKKYQLGDVIISDKVYPYFIGAKIKEGGLFVNDSNRFEISQTLKADIQTKLIDTHVFKHLRVFLGNYISGEAVVSNRKIRDIIRKAATNQPVLCGEMEGYGLFKECQGYREPIKCLSIKSICDWGTSKNLVPDGTLFGLLDEDKMLDKSVLVTIMDRIQAYASYQSCQVVDKVIKEEILEQSFSKQIKKLILDFKEESFVYKFRILNNILNTSIAKQYHHKFSDDFVFEIVKQLIADGLIVECNQNTKKFIFNV